MDNGERDFYFNRGADGQLSVDEIEAIDPGAYGIFHFGSATGFLEGPLQSAYKALLLRALDNKVFISFDPNYRHLLFRDNTKSFVDQSWDFLKVCDFFKVSDEESMLLTGASTVKDAAADLLAKTKGIFAITIGKEGALLGMNNRIEQVSGITVKPIDTTGAGDAFTGAVLYQLSQHDNIRSLSASEWKEILFNGNKAGARTCEFMGAMEAFKHLSNNIFK
jgi:fructokinase